MMRALEFLETAEDLLTGSREADWRSSVSRAYYAVFKRLCEVFVGNIELRLLVPSGSRRKPGHDFVKRCLQNCQTYDPEVPEIGNLLEELKTKRHDADYDLSRFVDRDTAKETFEDARDLADEIERLTPERITRSVSQLLEVSPYGYPPESQG